MSDDKSPHEMMLAHQQRIAEINAEGEEPGCALEYLQDIYKGRRAADHVRMRAAAIAIAYESPKLAITGYIRDDESFAAALDRAITRSREEKVVLELTANPDGGKVSDDAVEADAGQVLRTDGRRRFG
jgi:hypothetical protein